MSAKETAKRYTLFVFCLFFLAFLTSQYAPCFCLFQTSLQPPWLSHCFHKHILKEEQLFQQFLASFFTSHLYETRYSHFQQNMTKSTLAKPTKKTHWQKKQNKKRQGKKPCQLSFIFSFSLIQHKQRYRLLFWFLLHLHLKLKLQTLLQKP